ncbi:hypothetical protein Angca_009825, partial [Angiostrongylus cantonensis]
TDVDDLYHYEIPGCGDPCTLDALRSAVDRQHFVYLPTDWARECGLAGPNVVNYKSRFIVVIYMINFQNMYSFAVSTAVLAFTTVLFAGVLLFDIMLRKKRHSNIARDPLICDDEE